VVQVLKKPGEQVPQPTEKPVELEEPALSAEPMAMRISAGT
jgi:hypothetical protein